MSAETEQSYSRLFSVSAMNADQRRSAERLLGHDLDSDGQLYILAFKPQMPNDEARRKALSSLRETFAAAERHADELGMNDKDIDDAVDEAMNAVRYGQP
jgi:hypothetical protein